MGFKEELLKAIPDDYLSDKNRYQLHIVATEYNATGKICEETAIELTDTIAEIYARVSWSYARVPIEVETGMKNIRSKAEEAVKDMMTGRVTMQEFSNIKCMVEALFNHMDDIDHHKVTAD